MIFIPVAPLPQLLRYTRYSLFFQRHRLPQPPQTHKLLLFRLSSAADEKHEFYSMESKCPHLGADLGHADVEDSVVVSSCRVLFLPGLGEVWWELTRLLDPVVPAHPSFQVCPWHQYDFDLSDGHSSTGMRLCVYQVEVRNNFVHVESPGAPGEDGWELVKFEPVSEGALAPTLSCPLAPRLTLTYPSSARAVFAELPAPPPQSAVAVAAPTPSSPPSLSKLSLDPSSAAPSTAAADQPTTLLTYALRILRTANPLRKVALTREALAFLRSPERAGQPLVLPEEGAWSRVEVGDETPPREKSKGGSVAPGRTGKRGKGGSEKSRNLMLRACLLAVLPLD